MKKYLILNVFLTFFFLISTVSAQQTTEISAEKKAVIAELLTVIKADMQTKEIMQAMFAQMDAMYPSVVDSMIDGQTDLNAEQKREIKQILIERNSSFNARFNEKFIKIINFQDYMNQVFYPLYDKFFTTEELKDLIAFYKTPTGQKSILTTPQLTGESMKLAQEYLIPQIDGLMKELMDEDLKFAKSNKNQPPAQKKNQD